MWLQRFDGAFRVLRINGPAFLLEQFLGDFGLDLAADTPVTLAQARTAPATPASSGATPTPATPSTYTTTASGTTHIVAPGETMSSIGARYGVDWMRIAEANGISGPDYLVRDGLVLTIPQ